MLTNQLPIHTVTATEVDTGKSFYKINNADVNWGRQELICVLGEIHPAHDTHISLYL